MGIIIFSRRVCLGNLPIVKSNFSIIVIAIIIISVIPAIVTFIKERKEESMGLE